VNAVGEDGRPLGEQLAGLALAEPALLETVLSDMVGPPCPALAVRAWEVFGQLHETRSCGMGGVRAITFTELDAFQRVTGQRLTPLDVALVREADRVFVAVAVARMTPDGPGADHEQGA
jgi:hypothetical protein